MYLGRMLRPGFLLLACCTASAAAQLTFQSNQPLILQGGAGTADFTIENKGDTKLTLALSAGSSTDETSHVALTAAKINLRLEPGTQPPPTSIDPHSTLEIAADITNMTASTAAQIYIFNGNARLGDIKAVALDAPLNISIDGAGSSNTPLAFTCGRSASITLKNGDPVTYPITWSFQVRGMNQSDKLTLPANGRSTIVLTPARSAYLWSDLVRPASETGQLLLSLDVPEVRAIQPNTKHSFPVNLTMRPMGSNWATIFSDIYVAIFLLMGGILSLLASSVLPNMLRKSSLRGQINGVADRTSSVSARVDSYLRVLLRLERKKIDILLRSTKLFSPSASDSLDDVSSETDRLAKRLTVAERLDDLRRELEVASATAPPSITGDVDAKLQAAADQMHSFALPDENVAAANKSLDDATAALKSASDASATAKQIAGNFKDLKTRTDNFSLDYSDLKAALPGVFKIQEGKFDDPNNITSPMAYAIDHGIAAIHTALDYVVVRESIPKPVSLTCSVPLSAMSTRVTDHECELIELLGTMSWQALRDARTLVREMREDIYEKDVLDEIGRPDQAEVVFDTQKARPYLPVNFSIGFKNPRFNGAAAIDRLSCKWEFPSDLNENGWKVCHFFQGNEPAAASAGRKINIKVTIQSQKASRDQPVTPSPTAEPSAEGEKRPTTDKMTDTASEPPVTGSPGTPVAPEKREMTGTIAIQPTAPPRGHSRSVAEGLRFLIAFGVALAGLLSGAVDQLQKLGLVPATLAIVGLGFGADAVKNLLTQTPKTQAPNKSGS